MGGMASSSSATSSATTTSSSSGMGGAASSSSATSSAVTSSSSSGAGGGPACMPEGPFNGQPVAAPANTWTWVDVPQAKCRDGSATGFGVRINPNSTKLFIYLEGGGACFNGISCTANPGSYAAANFNNWKGGGGTAGVFDTANAQNPIAGWNAVYIPYCTGDAHTGNATGVDVPGGFSPKNQSFVGYANVGYDLQRIIPTFPNMTEVLLTGVSAGGFGAAYNYDRVARDFCPTPVVLIDDSGPTMSDTYMTPCLQTRWRTLWGLANTLPADCPQCTGPNGGGLVNYVSYLAAKYPTGRLSLISSMQDGTITQFFGFGLNNCAQIDGFAPAMSGAMYTMGLNELRNMYANQSPPWGSYFINGTQHTWIGANNTFYNTTVQNVPLPKWFGDMVNGGPIANVGP